MSNLALLWMVGVQLTVTTITVYLLVKIMRAKNKTGKK